MPPWSPGTLQVRPSSPVCPDVHVPELPPQGTLRVAGTSVSYRKQQEAAAHTRRCHGPPCSSLREPKPRATRRTTKEQPGSLGVAPSHFNHSQPSLFSNAFFPFPIHNVHRRDLLTRSNLQYRTIIQQHYRHFTNSGVPYNRSSLSLRVL